MTDLGVLHASSFVYCCFQRLSCIGFHFIIPFLTHFLHIAFSKKNSFLFFNLFCLASYTNGNQLFFQTRWSHCAWGETLMIILHFSVDATLSIDPRKGGFPGSALLWQLIPSHLPQVWKSSAEQLMPAARNKVTNWVKNWKWTE